MFGVLIALAATLGTFVGAGVMAWHTMQHRRPYLAAWTVTLLGLTMSLGGTTVGMMVGFDQTLFRALELGGSLIAPMSLACGVGDLVARRRVQVRFAMWLAAASYTIVAAVIMMVDPVTGEFGSSMPGPGHYDWLPLMLIGGAHIMGVGTMVTSTAITAMRTRDRDPEAAPILIPIALLTGAGVLIVGGMGGFLPGILPMPVLGIAAALVWYASRRLGLPLAERGAGAGGSDGYGGYAEVAGAVLEAYGAYGDDNPADGADPRSPSDHWHRWGRRAAAHSPPAPSASRAAGADRASGAGRASEVGQASEAGRTGGVGLASPARRTPGGSFAASPAGPAEGTSARSSGGSSALVSGSSNGPSGGTRWAPYGHITVYTLHEGQEDAFDRLTEEAVRAVRDLEPGTLIYACHTARQVPNQRVFYQLYRDRMAYQEHERQPHIQHFLTQGSPYVRSTKVIELNLGPAKVPPMA